MKQALQHPFLPAPLGQAAKSPLSPASLNTLLSKLVDQANVDTSFGSTLKATKTISPTAQYHHVSGTGRIKYIAAPPGFQGGVLHLIPDGEWQTETGGNIATATQAVKGKTLIFTYDGTKYYPSY